MQTGWQRKMRDQAGTLLAITNPIFFNKGA